MTDDIRDLDFRSSITRLGEAEVSMADLKNGESMLEKKTRESLKMLSLPTTKNMIKDICELQNKTNIHGVTYTQGISKKQVKSKLPIIRELTNPKFVSADEYLVDFGTSIPEEPEDSKPRTGMRFLYKHDSEDDELFTFYLWRDSNISLGEAYFRDIDWFESLDVWIRDRYENHKTHRSYKAPPQKEISSSSPAEFAERLARDAETARERDIQVAKYVPWMIKDMIDRIASAPEYLMKRTDGDYPEF